MSKTNAFLTKDSQALADTIRRMSAVTDAAQFGAKGDDTHDDARVIQDAIDAAKSAAGASSSGGALVHLQAGAYRISRPLVLPSGIALHGAGPGATIIRPTDNFAGNAFLDTPNAAHYYQSVRDLQIDGLGKTTGPSVAAGLRLHSPTNASVFNVFVRNVNGDGIMLAAGPSIGVANRITDCVVNNNSGNGCTNEYTATDTSWSSVDSGDNDGHAFYIAGSNSRLSNCVGYGSIDGVYIDPSASGIWMVCCRFDQNKVVGITSGGKHVMIDGCFVHSNSANGANVHPGIDIIAGAGRHTLTGNMIVGKLDQGFPQQSYGIRLGANRTGRTTITGGSISDNGTGAITGNMDNLRISDVEGINPVGFTGSPNGGGPTNNVDFVNPYPYDCTVYLKNSGVNNVYIGGGYVSSWYSLGGLRVPVGQSIKVQHSGGVGWDWFAD